MQLVVAEKPSVAQTIAKVIGAEKKGRWLYNRKRLYRILVRWAFGGTCAPRNV